MATHSQRLVKSEVIGVTRCPNGVGPHAAQPSRTAEADGEDTAASFDLGFDDVYRDYFAFVWRSAKRLGIYDAALDDVVQEVFVIVHRRLQSFEGRSLLRTWLFGITVRVARHHKRGAARKSLESSVEPDSLHTAARGPGESLETSEAVRLIYAILDELDDDRREVFVLAEFEQLPMSEIAVTLGINVNTGYSRLRAARHAFECVLARHRASDEWRLR
jgi:RNA polymerase sigma-70 factor, ECF subfamily